MLGRLLQRVVGPSFVPLLLLALWSSSSPGRVSSTDSWPACPGLRAPVILGESTSLSFCDMVTGVSCCDADEDEALREQFEAMNVVADAECTTVVKGILCAVTRADPAEVRRIFTMDLPPQGHTSSYSQQQHGGQILFRPSDDGYLYLMTGHGGDQEANHGEFSSNKSTSSFLGKIVRFNIDGSINGQSGGGASNRTENRSGTTTTTAAAEPEIFAAGLGNPRGCSFDSARPSYLFCASVDEQQYESVHLIGAPSANAAVLVVGYGWRSVSGTPSIVGGRVYRGSADPSLEGRYLYMYGASAWAAEEAPASSGSYVSAQIPIIRCSRSSPAPCTGDGGVHGRVVSFGEDNSNDAFVLATGGVYRVVEPSFCRARRSRSSAASALPWLLCVGACALVSAFYICWRLLAGGQRPVMNCGNGWLFRCFACIVCPCCNCNCCNSNVMSINHGPGAGREASLQLGA